MRYNSWQNIKQDFDSSMQNSLFFASMFGEVIFGDHLGGLNGWALGGAILHVEMFYQSPTRS